MTALLTAEQATELRSAMQRRFQDENADKKHLIHPDIWANAIALPRTAEECEAAFGAGAVAENLRSALSDWCALGQKSDDAWVRCDWVNCNKIEIQREQAERNLLRVLEQVHQAGGELSVRPKRREETK